MSSSSTSAAGGAAALAVLAPAADRRIAPPCWTPDETLALIDSYGEKWHSLRRGNLRAPHWDEVAAAVAARTRHLPASTPKTPVQCRHKIEKLRRRYRAERQRRPDASSPWPFFLPMHALEDAGHAAAARPPSSPDSSDAAANTRSIHRLLSNGGGRSAPALNPTPHRNPNPIPKGYVLKNASEEMAHRLRRKRGRGEGEAAMGELVAAVRMLGEGFVRMEKRKMEMAQEMEKVRMEMEMKRTEMMVETQRRIVAMFVGGQPGGGMKRDKVKVKVKVES